MARGQRRSPASAKPAGIDPRELFENSPTGIALLAVDGHCLACNRAFAAALGFEPVELVGLAGINLVCENDRDLAAEWLTQLASATDTETGIGLHMRHRNGHDRWMLLDGRRLPGRKEAALIVQARDSSGLHDYIGALEDLARRYETFLHASGDAIIALDEKGSIAFANGAAAAMLHRPVEELIGEPGQEVLPPPLTSLHGEAGLSEIEPAPGQRLPVLYRIAPVLDDGRNRGTIVVLSHLGAQLRQKLEPATAGIGTGLPQGSGRHDLLGTVVAGMAHDVDNPITHMYSNIAVLEYDLNNLFHMLDTYAASVSRMGLDVAGEAEIWLARQEIDIDRVRGDLKSLVREWRNSLNREIKIVRSLIDYTCQDNRIEWQSADLHNLLDGAVEGLACDTGSNIAVVRDYGALPTIECRPARLGQAFTSLLANAGQAIPEGRAGTITLRTGTDDRCTWIEITDDGTGISPEHLQRVFDPFFTTKPACKGIGLGLPLSRAIVDEHSGNLKIESEPGDGTRVRIELPFDRDLSAPDCAPG